MGGHKVGGHTDLHHIKIPDYRIYKVTKEGTPKLWKYQERLAREGLKDPWIRNLVWRYQVDPAPLHVKYSSFIIGGIVGLAAFAGFIWLDKNRYMSWHPPREEKYKLLYQLKNEDNEKVHH